MDGYALVTRLSEPSTYGGLAAGMTTLGVAVPQPYVQAASFILAGLFSVVAMFKKDPGSRS